jgi:hypothetical protein
VKKIYAPAAIVAVGVASAVSLPTVASGKTSTAAATRAVAKVAGGWFTTYRDADGSTGEVFDSGGPVTMTESSSGSHGSPQSMSLVIAPAH